MKFNLSKYFPLLSIFLAFSLNGQIDIKKSRQFVENNLTRNGLVKSDFNESFVSDAYESGGITFVYFQQATRGIKVFNGILNLVTDDQKKSFITGNRFIPDLSSKTKGLKPVVSPSDAVRYAFRHLGLPLGGALGKISESIEKLPSMAWKAIFKSSGSLEDIPAELVWLENNQRVNLCWNIRIKTTRDWWEIRIDATDGSFIEKNNWVAHCDFGSQKTAELPVAERVSKPLMKEQSLCAPMATGDYKVFDLPLESPIAGSQTIVNSPWNRAGAGNKATTLKWHNDGTTTYTTTRGNNVFAKDDLKADNEATAGASPSSATGEYVFTYQPNAAPAVNANAAITNLFFWNNTCHDVFYQYGFDEPSGNFQRNNQGRGGSGNDFVYADAMDGSGTNNANFSTPPDGSAPRMQMFLWSASGSSAFLKVNSPGSISGNYQASTAYFNPTNITSVTGNLVIASPADGCSAITNPAALAGKIAVIDRGTCTFVTKVKNAQNAGAIGVVIVNNIAGAPPNMSGTDNTITILTCCVSDLTGNVLKNTLKSSAVNATIQANQSSTNAIDGDFDNGIIVHEYGHGISTRLTGGPSNSSCLNNAEQMGEGWSDYFALMLTTDWAKAKSTDLRAIGNFAIGEGLTGGGIREYPYSYDKTKSLYNYDYARNNTAVHDLGSAWASMLWDMTWSIIAMEPPSPDIYNGNGGNNIALKLVMMGLKLQPCSPGFVDGRDAILKADEILYNNAHRCAIWEAFARRGLGLSASQGLRTSASDGVQAFDFPPDLGLTVKSSLAELKQGDIVDFNLTLRSECSVNNALTMTADLSPKLDFISSSGGSYDPVNRRVSFPPMDVPLAQSITRLIKAQVRTDFSMPSLLFSDDAEGGSVKWKTSNTINNGTPLFSIGPQNPNSGTRAWFVSSTANPTNAIMTLANPISIPANSQLSFWHYQKVEPTGDGGVVEISTDNGATWLDLGNNIIQNGYTGTIDPATDNVLKGKKAFTGETAKRKTVVNLNSYSGKTALFRFRYGSDTGNLLMADATGWFIDDIQVSIADTCVLLKASASNLQKTVNGSVCVPLKAEIPVITGIETLETSGPLIYPNPVSETLHVDFGSVVSRADLRIFDVTGRVIKSFNSGNSDSYVLDLKDVPPSTYILEISNGSRQFYHRIVRQ